MTGFGELFNISFRECLLFIFIFCKKKEKNPRCSLGKEVVSRPLRDGVEMEKDQQIVGTDEGLRVWKTRIKLAQDKAHRTPILKSRYIWRSSKWMTKRWTHVHICGAAFHNYCIQVTPL